MSGVEASRLVRAVEEVWGAIQRRHSGVPPVVVTLGAGSVGVPRGVLKLGHFAADRWTAGGAGSAAVAELFVGGEGLAQGAESVLATLLHEAAHGLADVRGVQDTSRQGRYHNTRYKALGEELGLVVTQVAGIGWSGTALADGTTARYAAELVQLAAAITAYRYAEARCPQLAAPVRAAMVTEPAADVRGAAARAHRRTAWCWSAAAHVASDSRAPPQLSDPSTAKSAIPSSARPRPAPVPTPTSKPSPSPTIDVQPGTVLAAVYGFKVVTDSAVDEADWEFDRDEFGPAWKDVDRNGCDQRNDVLRRDLTKLRTN